jgi:hypothetical protein
MINESTDEKVRSRTSHPEQVIQNKSLSITNPARAKMGRTERTRPWNATRSLPTGARRWRHTTLIVSLVPAPPATSAATPAALALPAGMSVVSIAMVSASDGWAIAAPTASSAVLVHYTGGRWILSGDTYAGIDLTDISMDTHDDGWAVGLYADQVSGGVVLHYSGGRWHPVPTPPTQFAGDRVWAFSPSQALVLASLPKGQTGASQSALLHYDNGAWTETASPRGITDASVLSADDVWATCFDGHILHICASTIPFALRDR